MATQRPLETGFDGVLDICASGIRAGQLTVEGCLEIYPRQAAQLRPLLQAALSLTGAQRPAMRDAARDALERRLRARVAEWPASRRASRPARRPAVRWLQLAVPLMVILVVLGAGVVTASASSLPGDLLYPVKRWGESVLVQVASGPGRVDALLSSARRRLEEFDALSLRGVVDAALLEDFAAHAQDAIAASETLSGDRQTETLQDVVALAARGLEAAQDLAVAAGVDLSRATHALSGLRAMAQRRLLSSPAPESTRTRTPPPARTPTRTPSRTPRRTATPEPPGRDAPGGGPPLTPPGHGTPGAGLTRTPPGRGTPPMRLSVTSTPEPPKPTPRGQGTPGGGVTAPPGQAPKSTKTKTP